MTGSNYDWTPKVGVGSVRFGAPIDQYTKSGLLESRVILPELGPEVHFVDDDEGIVVYVDDEGMGTVEIVACYRSLLYQSKELIGVTLDAAVDVLGRPPDEYEEGVEMFDETFQDIAYFDDLGLMLWFEDGVSVSASLDDGDYEKDGDGNESNSGQAVSK